MSVSYKMDSHEESVDINFLLRKVFLQQRTATRRCKKLPHATNSPVVLVNQQTNNKIQHRTGVANNDNACRYEFVIVVAIGLNNVIERFTRCRHGG